MNAEEQKILERIEFNKGGLVLNDIDWLISQLKAAQEEITELKSDDGLTTAYMCGYHKRDDEVRLLKEENERLKASIKWALGVKESGRVKKILAGTIKALSTPAPVAVVPWEVVKEAIDAEASVMYACANELDDVIKRRTAARAKLQSYAPKKGNQ